jgi:hypothetical protein
MIKLSKECNVVLNLTIRKLFNGRNSQVIKKLTRLLDHLGRDGDVEKLRNRKKMQHFTLTTPSHIRK